MSTDRSESLILYSHLRTGLGQPGTRPGSNTGSQPSSKPVGYLLRSVGKLYIQTEIDIGDITLKRYQERKRSTEIQDIGIDIGIDR